MDISQVNIDINSEQTYLRLPQYILDIISILWYKLKLLLLLSVKIVREHRTAWELLGES